MAICRAVRAGAAGALTIGLAGALLACGGESPDAPVMGEASRSVENATAAPPLPTESFAPAATAAELFGRIDTALAGQTSVRQDIGNLNGPGETYLHEYGAAGTDASYSAVGWEPGDPPTVRAYRIGDRVHVAFAFPENEASDIEVEIVERPVSDLKPRDTSQMVRKLLSDIRADFERLEDITLAVTYAGLGAGEAVSAGVGSVDLSQAQRYELTVRLAAYANPSPLPALLRGRRTGVLWVAPNGLPVRLEVAYSEPLLEVEGTGTVVVDYSAWSAPVDLDPADLDRADRAE